MPPPNTPEEGLPLPAPDRALHGPQALRRGRRRHPSDSSASTAPRDSLEGHATSPVASSSRSSSQTSNRTSTNTPQPPSQPEQPSPAPTLINAPTIDFQALDYIDDVDETLLCPICKTPFYRPITTKACGHTFCFDCLSQAHAIQPVCPVDRQPLSLNAENLCRTRIIADQLDRLRVRCPNHARGCDHTGPRGLISTHVERYCEMTLVRCPDPTCTKEIPRLDATAERGCLHRARQDCEYCGKAGIVLADLEHHYDTACSGHTAKCDKCSAMVVRHRLSRHVESECPETQRRCKWHPFGCTLLTRRKVVDEHEKNGCIYQAIGELMKSQMRDHAVIADLESQLRSMDVRMRKMENSRAREMERARERQREASSIRNAAPYPAGDLRGDGRRRESRDSANALGGWDFDENDAERLPHSGGPWAPIRPNDSNDGGRGSMPTWESRDDYMLSQFERMERRMEDLGKSTAEMDNRHGMMLLHETLQLQREIAELRSNMGVLNMHTTWLMQWQRQSRGRGNAGVGPGGSMAAPGSSGSAGGGAGSGDNARNMNANSARDGGDDGDRSGFQYYPAPPRRMSGEQAPRL